LEKKQVVNIRDDLLERREELLLLLLPKIQEFISSCSFLFNEYSFSSSVFYPKHH